MGKAKRESHHKNELIKEEHLSDVGPIPGKDTEESGELCENECSALNSYAHSARVKRFVETLEIHCAAWGRYNSSVEQKFSNTRKLIRDHESDPKSVTMSEIAKAIDAVLDAI